MHMVASPYLPPVRFNSYSNLTYDRAGRADGMALFPGNGILCAETKATKHPEKFTESRGRDEAHVTSRPIRRQLPRWRTQSPSNLSPRKSFPGIREKYREKIGGVTNPASIGGAVHALKSSTLDEIAEQKCSEEQGISDRITGKQILKTGKLFVLL